jgi:hypothetical protein
MRPLTEIILCINYLIVTFIKDSAVINDNYGELQDLIFLFKILMGTRKNFFELCRRFGHADSEMLASPDQSDTTVVCNILFEWRR